MDIWQIGFRKMRPLQKSYPCDTFTARKTASAIIYHLHSIHVISNISIIRFHAPDINTKRKSYPMEILITEKHFIWIATLYQPGFANIVTGFFHEIAEKEIRGKRNLECILECF